MLSPCTCGPFTFISCEIAALLVGSFTGILLSVVTLRVKLLIQIYVLISEVLKQQKIIAW